uniref:Uncharacterized protein n=1 Tax=Lepeophtheirus salmonis TaxID=72036 RepID=A0A0K2T931_LEPSM
MSVVISRFVGRVQGEV